MHVNGGLILRPYDRAAHDGHDRQRRPHPSRLCSARRSSASLASASARRTARTSATSALICSACATPPAHGRRRPGTRPPRRAPSTSSTISTGRLRPCYRPRWASACRASAWSKSAISLPRRAASAAASSPRCAATCSISVTSGWFSPRRARCAASCEHLALRGARARPGRPGRLPDGGAGWGTYYAHEPSVMAGRIR